MDRDTERLHEAREDLDRTLQRLEGIEPPASAPDEAPVASEPGAPPLQIRNDLAS